MNLMCSGPYGTYLLVGGGGGGRIDLVRCKALQDVEKRRLVSRAGRAVGIAVGKGSSFLF